MVDGRMYLDMPSFLTRRSAPPGDTCVVAEHFPPDTHDGASPNAPYYWEFYWNGRHYRVDASRRAFPPGQVGVVATGHHAILRPASKDAAEYWIRTWPGEGDWVNPGWQC